MGYQPSATLSVRIKQLGSDITFYSNLKIKMTFQMIDLIYLMNLVDSNPNNEPDWSKIYPDDPNTPQDETEEKKEAYISNMETKFGKPIDEITTRDALTAYREILRQKLGYVEPMIQDLKYDQANLRSIQESDKA